MCSITPETAKIGSNYTCYSHKQGSDISCWFSDRSNCKQWSFEAVVLPINRNIYTDHWEPIVIYITLLLYWSLYNYTAHAADILTPTTAVQGVDNHSWYFTALLYVYIHICSNISISIYREYRHDDVIKWKHFPRYWPLCGDFTGHRWIPHTNASDVELWCFVSSTPE